MRIREQRTAHVPHCRVRVDFVAVIDAGDLLCDPVILAASEAHIAVKIDKKIIAGLFAKIKFVKRLKQMLLGPLAAFLGKQILRLRKKFFALFRV